MILVRTLVVEGKLEHLLPEIALLLVQVRARRRE